MILNSIALQNDVHFGFGPAGATDFLNSFPSIFRHARVAVLFDFLNLMLTLTRTHFKNVKMGLNNWYDRIPIEDLPKFVYRGACPP